MGEPPERVKLLWDGADGGTLLELDALNDARFERITWDGNGKAAVLVRHAWRAMGGFGHSWLQHVDSVFRNAEQAIQAGYMSFQASEVAVRRCVFEGLTQKAVTLDNGNVLNWWFRECLFRDCEEGVVANFGGFFIRKCTFLRSRKADLRMTQSTVFGVRDSISSGSKAFLVVEGNANDWAHVPLRGNTVIQGDPSSAPIQVAMSAPFLFVDNTILGTRGPLVTGWAQTFVSMGNRTNLADGIGLQGLSIDNRVDTTLSTSPAPPPPSVPAWSDAPVIELAEAELNAEGIEAAIGRAKAMGRRAVVHFPPRGISVARTVTVPANADVVLAGDSVVTNVQLDEGATGPVFRVLGPTRVTFKDMRVTGRGRNGIAVEQCNQAGAHVHMEDCRFGEERESALVVRGIPVGVAVRCASSSRKALQPCGHESDGANSNPRIAAPWRMGGLFRAFSPMIHPCERLLDGPTNWHQLERSRAETSCSDSPVQMVRAV